MEVESKEVLKKIKDGVGACQKNIGASSGQSLDDKISNGGVGLSCTE